MVRQSAEVENQMTSLERVKEYCELPSEKSNVISITHVPDSMSNWPSKGEMKISELKMRYRPELDLALNGLDVVISSGEKIGVCGRTGAGKSSLFTAFYRLCEYESGTVFIDGIDISQIPLDVLRNNIIIIPQEPVMFSGTIRSNLDPFGSCSDEKIWEALEAVQLKEVVQNLENLLETQLEDNKFSFSIGQSQLICIARAIIRPSKILLVDEATANVDSRTDKIIQSVIRSKFSDRTVITIAHRLNTIIDSDKILVMDAGKLAEFDTPKELIKIKNGKFKSLLEESGTTILP
jgi:ABC-type multidrug transport system fused ATPase/permease subunit